MFKNTYYMPNSSTYYLAFQHLSIKWDYYQNSVMKPIIGQIMHGYKADFDVFCAIVAAYQIKLIDLYNMEFK